jgi:WXG100 family type VII secretion target
MAERLGNTSEELYAAAEMFRQASSDIQAHSDRLGRLMSGLATSWEGDSFDKFSAQYEDAAGHMKDATNMCDLMGRQLTSIIDALISVECSDDFTLRHD